MEANVSSSLDRCFRQTLTEGLCVIHIYIESAALGNTLYISPKLLINKVLDAAPLAHLQLSIRDQTAGSLTASTLSFSHL